MLNNLLIALGLRVDPALLAGRPDRFVDGKGETIGSIKWGPECRHGRCEIGPNYGEWELIPEPEPEEGAGETTAPPPLPRPRYRRKRRVGPYREGRGGDN